MRSLVWVGALALASCGSPSPSAPGAPLSASAPTRFPIAGLSGSKTETFRWRMDVRGVEVARFEQRVAPAADALRVVSRAKLSGVARFFRVFEAQAVAIIDRARGATRTALVEFRGQGRFHRVSMRFDGDRVQVIGGDADSSAHYQRKSVGGLTAVSSDTFLLSLRHWRPERGDRMLAAVIAIENMWLLELSARAIQTLATPLGERRARELAGTARRLTEAGDLVLGEAPRAVRVFISDDDEQLPLLVETRVEGSPVKVRLTEYVAR